ncbi:MAG TPA: phosphotransferase [Fimbriimonadaceae bacterium]|nr:phosphotransferase [Fimbriimonadaceae bacterium]
MIRQMEESIAQAIDAWAPGAALRTTKPLGGGMSAQVLGLELEDGRSAVLRHPSPFLASLVDDPARYEFEVLAATHGAGLPVPRPLAFGSGWLLMEMLDGTATAFTDDPKAYAEQMATTLARIHVVEVHTPAFSMLMETRRTFTPPDGEPNLELREPEVASALIDSLPDDPGPYGLRHGDYWPGNVLWQQGRITGVIDWENALKGPAIADLAVSRLDMWWVFGREAMDHFTACYVACRPIDLGALRYWDLRAALRPMRNLEEWAAPYPSLHRPDIDTVGMQRGLLAFIEDALAR